METWIDAMRRGGAPPPLIELALRRRRDYLARQPRRVPASWRPYNKGLAYVRTWREASA